MINKLQEETLDPENWVKIRELGYQIIDDLLDSLENHRERKCWQPITEETINNIRKDPLPLKPAGPINTYNDFKTKMNLQNRPIIPLSNGMLGWLVGQGTVMGMYSNLIASGLNDTTCTTLSEAYHFELKAIEWVKEMLNYPMESSGIFTSGASMANLIALNVARNDKTGYDVRKHGLHYSPHNAVYYSSTEVHSSVQKALEILGIGYKNIRKIPVNKYYQISIDNLKKTIKEDKEAGFKPVCVIAGAGTTNTAAFDDLNALAEVCGKEDMWLHVDGAFGAWVALCEKEKHLVSGLEKADSLVLDLHKWISVPNGLGCVLVKDSNKHRNTFDLTPEYLRHDDSTGVWLDSYGFELTRFFRSLGAWMTFKEHGVEKFARVIQQNIDQARYLESLIESNDELEKVAPVTCNVVCFRFVSSLLSDDILNDFNERLLESLWMEGRFMPSSTTLNGVYALRVAFINHRVKMIDINNLVSDIIRIGNELLQE